MAAARKVSPATSITLLPSARNLAASLPIVVVLPEPLTPATRMTNGRASLQAAWRREPAPFRSRRRARPSPRRRDTLVETTITEHGSDTAGEFRSQVARINSPSNSPTAAASSLRFDTRSAMAPPSDDDVRLSPPLRRFHQLPLCVLSFMTRP